MFSLVCAALLGVSDPPSFQTDPAEARVRLPLVRNGGPELPGVEGRGPLPFWKVVAGNPGREQLGGDWAIDLGVGDAVRQPLAAWPAAADSVEFTMVTSGPVTVSLMDGRGGAAGDVPLAGLIGEPGSLKLTSADLGRGLGRPAEPRFLVSLIAEDAPAFVRDVQVSGLFPDPTVADLRAEIEATLAWSFGEFLERALDDAGPRATSFVAHDFDVDSGARIGQPARRVTYHPLWGQLLDAWAAAPRDDWEQALTAYLTDFLELGLHPETGLPRFYDPVADTPLDDEPIEVRVHFEFLLDAAEYGPEALRAACGEAAARIGEQVLATGVLPDGSICPRYRPSDGQAQPGTVPIRRLDVPAALARLGALTGDVRFRDAAVEAVRELAYDHYWPGTWDRIDPGFDDNFGHYGERATAMWAAWPEEAAFADLARSGIERYLPLWRDALRFGGNIAADQVRCWRIAVELAHLDANLAPRIAECLDDAVWVHFTGQQAPGGSWIDVTVVGHDPQRLPVGDTAGVPQNLLEGLAVATDEALGLDARDLRARFTAVMRTTLSSFGGAHGLIATTRRAQGDGSANPAIGSLRFHPGLIEMLERLPRD